MGKPRETLLTGAQLARALGLTRSRISQLRYAERCPVTETTSGDRFKLEEFMPWYLARRGGSAPPAGSEAGPLDHDAEGIRRMTAVVHKAIAQHVEALTSDRGLTRFLELLDASGLDTRTRYLAKRSAQLWLGTTLPNGEVSVTMETPTEAVPATWEAEWRAAMSKTIARHAA
jgi:hypothetical protein